MAKKEVKTNKKENNKNKKSFAKDFKAELKKVVWPTPKQLLNNTVAVITIVLITAIIVFVLDLAFETVNKHGVEKVKEMISSSDTTNEATDNTENNDVTTKSEENNESENNTEVEERETQPETVEESAE